MVADLLYLTLPYSTHVPEKALTTVAFRSIGQSRVTAPCVMSGNRFVSRVTEPCVEMVHRVSVTGHGALC